MKKAAYSPPHVWIVEMHSTDRFLLSLSDTTVTGDKGGWVKEDPVTPAAPHSNVWDDDWRPEEERNNQGWR